MPKTLKYSLLVFAGGCCYGIVIPLVRSLFAQGFSTSDVMTAQYLFGVVFLALVVALFSRRKITLKQVAQLIGLGIVAAGVSYGYYHALDLLSAATSVTLLFQFVWMGVVLQALVERRLPKRMTVLAVLVIMVGTFLAAGVFEQSVEGLDPLGVFFGILSAVCYTVFLFASGRIAVEQPAINRTLFTSAGSLLITFALAPGFFVEGALQNGIAIFGIPLALVGIFLPIVLIQTGAPHLPSGLTTIMASGEMPCGILAAAIFLGDTITAPVAAGVIIILAGIVLSQLDDVREALKRHNADADA
ncbi:MAG: DMT family transporter [Coriobacteriales bacterium]|jgi:drug/metabolite transporter (DMT)-like permease|nr:DMT family transporter [Coriobacteriales bacterium]